MNKNCNAAGFPLAEGLYDPAFDHDNCGVGFVARMDARPSHVIVENAVQVLINLEHRGPLGYDTAVSGDGAGLLMQIPDDFFRSECQNIGVFLPDKGYYAVGMVFLPSDEILAERCVREFDRISLSEKCEILGWRKVPVEWSCLSETARSTKPQFCQVFLRPADDDFNSFERRLYIIRRRLEKEISSWNDCDPSQFYIASLSGKTVVYKGLLTGSQLQVFFPDLQNKDFSSSFAIVHQRYSTNNLPTWNLAQPLRLIAHNGQLNSLSGNVNQMRIREPILKSDIFGPDIEKIKPVVVEGGSDSSAFDNVLEMLCHGGRSLPHAIMMMIPEAWGGKFYMGDDRRAFYEYHSAIMEPWDGPAVMVFTDGRYVGATLDRNGLRSARYTITRDGIVILASETGVLDFPGDQIRSYGRLQPGKMFLVDLEQNRVVPDNIIKSKICRQKPYRHWVKDNRIELRGLLAPAKFPPEDPEALLRKHHAFGYTAEELKMVGIPLVYGQEAIGAMGDDTPLAVLSNRPRLLFSYFKQLFAQVTSPPIDPLREELVMSLMSFAGRKRNLLEETPEHFRILKLHHPILTPEDLERIKTANHPDIIAREIDILFPAEGDGEALKAAIEEVFQKAEVFISEGATFIVLTDRNMDEDMAPIPSLLATSGLHHYLIRKGLRTSAGLIVETGEARQPMHFAILIGYGANAVCPKVAYSTVRDLAETMYEKSVTPDEAADSYITAIKKGILKTMSRMGISTVRSYFGAQMFEAIGLDRELVDSYFTGTCSRVGGIGLEEIAAETMLRHRKAYPESGKPSPLLDVGGEYHNRYGGEKHLLSPDAICKLQQAVRDDDYLAFKEYARMIDNQADEPVTLRSLLDFRNESPIPLEDVEPVEKILPRFSASAMSFGALSRVAHETIAVAMNRLGCRSNTGEGGEDPARYKALPDGSSRRSAVKQIASGRFGVTTEYIVNADELQIKIAQGAKPGEGGQLPGNKVSGEIARVRHTTPGVTLISPPPHHDIYSIEDLTQLIHDLRAVNPKARISVKLVAEAGVGAVATGVAKSQADMVLICGHDGGTGSSPITSIMHVGIPWEIGLAEVQQALIRNRIRDRIAVQVDGQLKTGRDLAVAALLGADEFAFGTIILVAIGCVMLRKCHLNSCSVGIATQDPRLAANFHGKPEYVERLMRFIAMNLREYMAELGFRSLDEMIGHVEMLRTNPTSNGHRKAHSLDFSAILASPGNGGAVPLRCTRKRDIHPDSPFDETLLRMAQPALDTGEPVHIAMPIYNINRSVASALSGKIVRRYGARGLPPDTIRFFFKGTAGQSLGAFLAPGVTIRVEGSANDYLGKGMSGGRIILAPSTYAGFKPWDNIIAGNTALYGATGGEVYIYGIVGERFAVRNSGASAVVEGVGDHGCEYMTGGVVVILGTVGNNFAAGMSGGIAYVYNESEMFESRCNLDMVDLESVWTEEDKSRLYTLLENHFLLTDSKRAGQILENWEADLPMFIKVMPIDYRLSLERMRLSERSETETPAATEEVYNA
ncbi:MAG: glutamate synthase large subunit [Candidatus Latescibacter sp.]|nr:glutamate synthase large subunit [Candidatus Latescibacter sp.]